MDDAIAINDPGNIENQDPENIENVAPDEELENIAQMQPPNIGEDQPPAKKKRIRKTKAKKHQVGAKNKNRNQRNYR